MTQLLTESLVLALAGGIASLGVAALSIDFLVTNGPVTLPRLREAGLQVEVLLFALGVTGLAAILFWPRTLAACRARRSPDPLARRRADDVRSRRSRPAALWPDEDPIGKRLSTWYGRDTPEWREVVGVVADARSSGQTAPAPTELFLPYTQAPAGAWNAFQRSMALIVRSSDEWPEIYVPAIRQAVRSVDPSVPVFAVRSMERVFVDATASRRFYLRLVLVLAACGLGLALLGIYGVVSFVVRQRTPEIGLRLAIGAERRDVAGLVIGQALKTTAIGLAIGIAAALMLTRIMSTLLFEIEPTDRVTFAAASVLLLLAGIVAALMPSVKAARVDPLVALRHE